MLGKNRETRFEKYEVAKYRLFVIFWLLGSGLFSKERYVRACRSRYTIGNGTKLAANACSKPYGFHRLSSKTLFRPFPAANSVVLPESVSRTYTVYCKAAYLCKDWENRF